MTTAVAPHVDLVRTIVTALERVRDGEIAGVHFCGLDHADPERRALAQALLADQVALHGWEARIQRLERGQVLSIRRSDAAGDLLEVDLAKRTQDLT